MPLIRINTAAGDTISVNTQHIIQFYELGGNTRIDLRDNISHEIKDSPRQLRGYINKAEGLLNDRVEFSGNVDQDLLPVKLPGIQQDQR